jgi:hypothetical protein
LQQSLFEAVVQPLVFALGLGQWMEVAFEGTGWLLVGLLQLVVMLLVIQPLEWWRPVEPVTDRWAVRSDVVYTLIHRLGLFRLVLSWLITSMRWFLSLLLLLFTLLRRSLGFYIFIFFPWLLLVLFLFLGHLLFPYIHR